MPPENPDPFRRQNEEEIKLKREDDATKGKGERIIDKENEDPARAGRGGAHGARKKEMVEGRMELQFLEREDLDAFIQMLLAAEEKKKEIDRRDALRSIFNERIETKLGVLRVSFLGGIADDRKERVARILEETQWTEDGKKGVDGLFEFYMKAERDAAIGSKGKKREEMEKRIFGDMKSEDLTKEERVAIMRTFIEEVVLYKMFIDDSILHAAIEDEETYRRIVELARKLDRKSDSLAMLLEIESVIAENARNDRNSGLARLLELGTLTSSIVHEEPKQETEMQGKTVNEKKESDLPLSVKLRESVSSLTEVGKQTVQGLLRTGMSDVAITMLQGDQTHETANGIQANVAGGILEAELRDDQTVNVYYTSEDGEKILIDLWLEPLPAALDHARVSAMNRTIEVSLLMGQRELNDKLLHALGGIDVSDTEFMENAEANDWRRMLKILFWKKATSRDERNALMELGLLEENGRMNPLRAAWMKMYLKYRKGQSGLEGVTFDELRKITQQWDADRSFSVTRE